MSKKTDSQVFFPKGKKIEIAGEKFEIKPFVLKTRNKVLNIITEVLADISQNNTGLAKATQAELTMLMVKSAGSKLIDLYQIVLDKDKEWLENNIMLKDEINIITAIWEINDIPFFVEQVKSLTKKTTLEKR